MNQDKAKKTIEFKATHCKQCNGFGYALSPSGKHIKCPSCDKKNSVYGLLDEEVLYWDKDINNATIAQNKVQNLLRNIINFALIIFTIIGVLGLVYYWFMNREVSILDLFFSRHLFALIFWLSIVGDLYIYYRLDLDARKKVAMPKRPLGEDIKSIETELNWNILHKSDLKRINVANFYHQEALDVLEKTYFFAEKNKHHEIKNIDLIAKLSGNDDVRFVLARLGIDYQAFLAKLKRVLQQSKREEGKGIDFGLEAKKVFLSAYYQAYKNRREHVSPVELLLALAREDEVIADIFDDLEITFEKIDNVVTWIHLEKELEKLTSRQRRRSKSKPKTHMNKAMTARPTKLLDSVSQDFTLKAKMGQFFPLVGREKEVSEAFRVLKEGKGNVILVGESGTGKTTILEGVAQMMASEDVPANLQDKRLVVLDPGVFIAGASGIGGLEEKMVNLIYEIMTAGNVILAIEDIHNLLGAGSTSSGSDVAEILMNFLSQGYIKVIGTTTTPEYQKYIENKETFLRRFQMVKIPEMEFSDAIKVLEAKAGFLEYKHNVYFSYDALEACVKLTDRYIQDRHLPSKALDIQEEAAIYVKENKGEKSVIFKDDVAAVLSEKTNVEVTSITQSEAEKLLNLEEIMHERVVGQNDAVNAIAKALRRSREELRDTNRPISNFLFLGPTGVGKTETAKTIAEVYFGNESNMIRVDMSEYQEQHSIVKMIGDAGSGGYLTEAIKRTPFGIVLLDEIEKAHPDILNLFLQVMDDGRLTDGRGRTADFTNAIIIATSNAATDIIQAGINEGLSTAEIHEGLLEGELEKYFRPEFINRFDRVVVFESLTEEMVVEITRKMLAKLAQKLEEKSITFEVAEEAVVELAKKGYSPKFGARPMRRLLQDTVDDALAKLMLQQKISRRDKIVLHAGGQLEVQKAKPL